MGESTADESQGDAHSLLEGSVLERFREPSGAPSLVHAASQPAQSREHVLGLLRGRSPCGLLFGDCLHGCQFFMGQRFTRTARERAFAGARGGEPRVLTFPPHEPRSKDTLRLVLIVRAAA